MELAAAPANARAAVSRATCDIRQLVNEIHPNYTRSAAVTPLHALHYAFNCALRKRANTYQLVHVRLPYKPTGWNS